MNTYNIILAGVGGQGLVLTTKVICEAAIKAGYDVKSNDVIGLSQRGGKVWGSVRIGEKIHSPNIPPKHGDIIIGMEMLEAYRWRGMLKADGLVITNDYQIPPVPVITEQEPYPDDILSNLEKDFTLINIPANQMASDLGSVKVMNTILLGVMAAQTEIDKNVWLEAIKENVPQKFIDMNVQGFEQGYSFKSTH